MSMMPIVDDDLAAQSFRVHRSAMTSPRIHRAEIERIFAKSWLYVGHESEIPAPGDFVRRPVGGRPIFMVRGVKTGNINVFHNTCTHRGAPGMPPGLRQFESVPVLLPRVDLRLRRAAQGSAGPRRLRPRGELRRVRAQAGGARGDLPWLRLRQLRPATSSTYPAISPTPRTTSTSSSTAAAGQCEIVRGTNQYSFAANWKLLVENSIDGYHAESTHDTYFKYLVSIGTDLRGGVSGRAVDLGNGHAVIEYSPPWGRPVAKWEPLFGEDARTEIDRLRAGSGRPPRRASERTPWPK